MTKVSRIILESMSFNLYEDTYQESLTRNPEGETGAEFRLTAQSMNVWLPRIANIIVFMSSIGTDLMTMAFVPMRQLASTCASLSLPVGFIYAR